MRGNPITRAAPANAPTPATRTPRTGWSHSWQTGADLHARDVDPETFSAVGFRLADLLAQTGGVEALRAVAGRGNLFAADRLARVLTDRGDLHGAADALRPLADSGVATASAWLTNLIVHKGDFPALRTRVDAGDAFAAQQLPQLLAKQGQTADAERVSRFGLTPDGSIATEH